MVLVGLATRFIADGAKAVVIADFNADAVAAVGDEIGAQSFAVDVRDEAAIAAMVASVEAEQGRSIVLLQCGHHRC